MSKTEQKFKQFVKEHINRLIDSGKNKLLACRILESITESISKALWKKQPQEGPENKQS